MANITEISEQIKLLGERANAALNMQRPDLAIDLGKQLLSMDPDSTERRTGCYLRLITIKNSMMKVMLLQKNG